MARIAVLAAAADRTWGVDVALTDRDLGAEDVDFLITGAALIAQDIVEAIRAPLGSLPWDRDAGSNLLLWLNSPYQRDAEIIAELKRLATQDRRVDVTSIQAIKDGDGDFVLSFTPLGSSEVGSVGITTQEAS